MQNVVINMCEKFHDDRRRNDRFFENGKSDNNKNTNNTSNKNNGDGAWRPVSGSKYSAMTIDYVGGRWYELEQGIHI